MYSSYTICQQYEPKGLWQYQLHRSTDSAFHQLTLLILLLLSAVRNDMLLISFITTKFCSSRLKFYNREKRVNDAVNDRLLQMAAFKGQINILTWDLDQNMKTSPTIRKSSSASGSGHVSHLALQPNKLLKGSPKRKQVWPMNNVNYEKITALCCNSDSTRQGPQFKIQDTLVFVTLLYLLLST